MLFVGLTILPFVEYLDVDEGDVSGEDVDDLSIEVNGVTGFLFSTEIHAVHTFSNRGVVSNSVLTNVFRRGHGPMQTPSCCFSHGTVQSL